MQYTLFGIFFGGMFPLGALALDHYLTQRADGGVFQTFLANPIHFIVAMAPLVLGTTFNIIGRVQSDLQRQLAVTHEQGLSLWRIANEDNLTGEGNRHSLLVALRAPDASGVVMLIDLDKFKFVNDTLGHHVGDELLRAFAKRVAHRLTEGQSLHRLGGDEFVLFLRKATLEEALRLAREVIGCLTHPFMICETRVAIGGSIGIAMTDPAHQHPTVVLEQADLALYRAKKTFGNELCVYDPSMSEAATIRMHLEQEIQVGIHNNTFFLEYQPIMNLAEGRVRGFEALVRWNHPNRGYLQPEMFIPIAEVSGLIVALGEHVLRLACRDAMHWPSPLSVAVNVSVEQFKQRTFCDQVLAALNDSGLPPGRLVLEITESLFILDIDMVSLAFERLKRLGVRFALDDYGTGYSSINHLRKLDLDYIKLDRSFAKSTLTDAREKDVVRTIIKLGETFGLTATAEGIESAAELEQMRASGVTDAQGYFFARPMLSTAIPAFLATEALPTSTPAFGKAG